MVYTHGAVGDGSPPQGSPPHGSPTRSSSSIPSEVPDIKVSAAGEYSSSSDPLLPAAASQTHLDTLSWSQAYFLIGTLTTITLTGSMSTGLLNISIPRIQDDLGLSESFVLWPASIYSLTCGCFLLLAGSIADFVGHRIINLGGTLILGGSLVAAGAAQTGVQMIAFRGLQGLGVSMCFPTAISIVSHAFPSGKRRSIGFSCLGLGQPLGFSFGLVVGGAFERLKGGWRSGFYLTGAVIIGLTLANSWFLPKDRKKARKPSWKRFRTEIDWLGVLISSVCLGILSYVLAMITDSWSRIKQPLNATLLGVSIALIPTFIIWMHYQEKKGKPALVPNSLWKSLPFTSICLMVLLSWAVVESMDLFLSLFYQNVQLLSALDSSLRFLPSVVVGIALNVFTGILVHTFHMGGLVIFFSVLCVGSPLLMALIDPAWSYWYDAFWASILGPLACDVIFTVANLITTEIFSEETQGLAGAVFNTVAQFGASVGIAAMAVINSTVKKQSVHQPENEEEYLMRGYRAVFWACTGCMVAVCLIGAVGLRRVGRVKS